MAPATPLNEREALLPAGSVPDGPGVPCPAGTVVITDLHLAPLGDGRTDAFEAECRALEGAPRVAILGDLFDVWVGPKQERLEGSARVLRALRGLVDAGTAVEVVPGNRDSLLGPEFETATGARLHPEGFVAELDGGGRAALVHGDSLCTLDADYLRLRRVLRRGWVRALTRRSPLWLARRIGRRLRRESESRKPFKLDAERSIRPAAVAALAAATGAEAVICGHAHEPRDERVHGVRWVVVGAWGVEDRDHLVVGPRGDLRPTAG